MPAATDDQRRWAEVDDYFSRLLIGRDDALEETLEASDTAGLPAISVTPAQGKLLMIVAAACRAARILEIGTLGGYSTIWLARALRSGGRLVTIESERAHFNTASSNIARAGVGDRVDLRLGSALDVLPTLAAERADPFDLIFIDADKRLYAEFLDGAMRLARPGSLIVADNVVRKGAVADPAYTDEQVEGIRRFLAAVANDSRLTATVVQTVGAKGYDGWVVALVR